MLFAFGILALLIAGITQLSTNAILYRDIIVSDGIVPKKPKAEECRSWHREVSFANLERRDGSALDVNCEQARTLPGSDLYATNESGMRIHYRIFAGHESDEARPIWLHVHGITGDLLAGARYAGAAERLGFRLVAMEMSNHGLSDNDGRGAAYGCREWQDVVAVFTALTARFPKSRILITAQSMGTMATVLAEPALRAADARNQLTLIALEAPIASLPRLFSDKKFPSLVSNPMLKLSAWRGGYDFLACTPEAILPQVRTPLLIQHVRSDNFIPVTHVDEFVAKIPADVFHVVRIYDHGEHTAAWNGQPEKFENDLRLTFASAIAAPRRASQVGDSVAARHIPPLPPRPLRYSQLNSNPSTAKDPAHTGRSRAE